MYFEEYLQFVHLFNGILKNTPVDSAVYRTHYDLISLKIKNIEIFIRCFQKHVLVSDWFPTHIDLFNQLEEVEKECRKEAEQNNPLIQQYKKLKSNEIVLSDNFIFNKDPNVVNELRDRLLEEQKKIEEMKKKFPFLKNFE